MARELVMQSYPVPGAIVKEWIIPARDYSAFWIRQGLAQPRTGAMACAAGPCKDQQLGLQVHQDRGDRAAASAGGVAG